MRLSQNRKQVLLDRIFDEVGYFGVCCIRVMHLFFSMVVLVLVLLQPSLPAVSVVALS